MARIAGVDLPADEADRSGADLHLRDRAEALERHPDRSRVSPDIRIKDLSEDDVRKISRVIEEQGRVEGDLRKEISMNIKRLMEIGSWRGMRHRRNLPVRGQRTRTNARTRKGPRKGAVAKKKTSLSHGKERSSRRVGRRNTEGGKKERRRQAQEDVQEARREAHRPPWLGAYPGVVQQHDRDDHRSPRGTWSPGRAPAASASRDRARARRSLRRRRRINAGNAAKESACASLEVRVKGPGAGRESAIRALQTDRPRHQVDQRRHADSAQRLPSAEAAPRLTGCRGVRMARYIGPVCRLCRREGMKLFLKGERCFTEKCAIEKRNFPPGQHGKPRMAKLRRLRPAAAREAEGQAHLRPAREPVPPLLRAAERQAGITGEILLQLLERRLDNVVYRLGLRDLARAGPAARAARPLPVNGKKVNIPSVLGEGGRRGRACAGRSAKNADDQHAMEEVKGRGIPEWLEFDAGSMQRPRSSRCRRARRSTCPCRSSSSSSCIRSKREGVACSSQDVDAASSASDVPKVASAPAAFTDLRREAGDHLQVWRRSCGPVAKGQMPCCGKVSRNRSGSSSSARR